MPPLKKKKPPPGPNDPLYKFYTSLLKQNPKSKMALNWLCENGLAHVAINIDKLVLEPKKY